MRRRRRRSPSAPRASSEPRLFFTRRSPTTKASRPASPTATTAPIAAHWLPATGSPATAAISAPAPKRGQCAHESLGHGRCGADRQPAQHERELRDGSQGERIQHGYLRAAQPPRPGPHQTTPAVERKHVAAVGGDAHDCFEVTVKVTEDKMIRVPASVRLRAEGAPARPRRVAQAEAGARQGSGDEVPRSMSSPYCRGLPLLWMPPSVDDPENDDFSSATMSEEDAIREAPQHGSPHFAVDLRKSQRPRGHLRRLFERRSTTARPTR